MSQLFMRKENTSDIPPLRLPEGILLSTHLAGMEKSWEELIAASFGASYSFDTMLTKWSGYAPGYVFYLSREGAPVATASAVANPDFPGEGWLHMVGTHPAARGLGLGKLASLAVLRSFAERGIRTAVLSTDDHRIPAIVTYLKLGFRPIILDDTHEGRWAKIFSEIGTFD